MMDGFGMMGGLVILWVLLLLALIVLAVTAVVWLVRNMSTRDGGQGQEPHGNTTPPPDAEREHRPGDYDDVGP